MTTLRLRDLSRHFGGLPAVDGVDLDVEPGSITAIIGPNGAGKSTLLRTVAGLLAPTSGRVELDGRDITGLAPHRVRHAGVATVLQSPRPFVSMTVREDVTIGAVFGRATARGRAAAEDAAVGAIDVVGLAGAEDRPVTSLTLHERRSLALARALASGPRVLLLDEVMAGATGGEVDETIELLRRVRDETGVSVLWVEHVVGAVRALADQVVVLERGRVLAGGAAVTVMHDPAVVEAYLGDVDSSPGATVPGPGVPTAPPAPTATVTRPVGARPTTVSDTAQHRGPTRSTPPRRERPPVAPVLAAVGLSAGYDGADVVHEVSLEVAGGEAVAIVGTNGAGKTTLLHAIGGLLPVSGGRVVVDGDDVTGATADRLARAGVAHVPAARHLFPGMSVEENLTLGAYPGTPRRQELEDVLTLFPVLGDRRRQRAGSLSGGEQRMLAIGRALVGRPRLLLLDEPTTGLAPRVAAELLAAVGALRDRGVAVLLAEQHVRAALELADRGHVLEQGRIVLTGSGPSLLGDDRVRAAYLGAG